MDNINEVMAATLTKKIKEREYANLLVLQVRKTLNVCDDDHGGACDKRNSSRTRTYKMNGNHGEQL
jgi:hypothetical protein